MSVSHICKCPKCGYEEKVWFDDEYYGYRPTCRTKTCEDYGKEIFDECIYQRGNIIDKTTVKQVLTMYKIHIPYNQASWTLKRKKEFLNSLFLKFPFGTITVYEGKDSYYIIDGLERISTLKEYFTRPSSLINFDEYFEKIMMRLENFIKEKQLSISASYLKNQIKEWYESLNELYKFEKLSVLHNILKDYIGDIEIIESLLNILINGIEIEDELALIIYKEKKDNIPLLYKNINMGRELSNDELNQRLGLSFE